MSDDTCTCQRCQPVERIKAESVNVGSVANAGTFEIVYEPTEAGSLVARQQAAIDELVSKIGWMAEANAILEKHGLR
jgi:hypothetical protein